HKVFYSFLVFFLILSFSCSNNSDKTGDIEQIAQLEKKLFENSSAYFENQPTAEELIVLYENYYKNFPDDSLTPEFIFKAAETCRSLNKGEEAIKYYDIIFNEYKDFGKYAYCLFLKGFVYENVIKDILKAKKYYTLFIEKYPDHDFADDAKILIEQLGKSPEELIRSFEENQLPEEDTVSVL
ncbi:MAG: tetratricopeptide repeat protein, partial [Bacteroidota bacterium]